VTDMPTSWPLKLINWLTQGRSVFLRAVGWLIVLVCVLYFVAPKYVEDYPDIVPRLERYSFVILLFSSLIIVIFRELTNLRKDKYANIQNETHSILHMIRDLTSFLDQIQKQKLSENVIKNIKNDIETILDSFTRAFSILTGNYCRASIKRMHKRKDSDDLFVYTFARDRESTRSQRLNDKKRQEEYKDKLNDNEDFKLILDGDQPWFFCNDLPSRSGYKNSRLLPVEGPDKETWFTKVLKRIHPYHWELEYRSAIVWPIQQGLVTGIHECQVVGFLTIDSRHRRVFKSTFDTEFGAAIADSLYHCIRRLEAFEHKSLTQYEQIRANKTGAEK
jgi:hypothetical protein